MSNNIKEDLALFNELINIFLEDLIQNLLNEKEIYERENQIEAFKTRIKPVFGRSFSEEELAKTVLLKKQEFTFRISSIKA